MDENNKFDVVGTNIAEKATMIWNVADMIRGPFKPNQVSPLLQLRRAISSGWGLACIRRGTSPF